MKIKILLSFLCIVIIMSLVGCHGSDDNNNAEKEGDDMAEIDIFDFAFIKKAPEVENTKDFEKVIKIYFNENDSSNDKGFAIDLEKNDVYSDTGMGSRGVRTSVHEPENIHNIDEIIEILKKYNVHEWEQDYTHEDPDSYQDGYSWKLWLQFEDGTVEKHKGSGTDDESITPEYFKEFTKEFRDFVKSNIG